jgi:hypothetical protein
MKSRLSSLIPAIAMTTVFLGCVAPSIWSQATTGNEPLGLGPAASQDAAAIHDAETGWYKDALKTREQRLAWWREARFGCFIHWGAYSVLGGEWQGKPNPGYAEHIMRVDKIPLNIYREQVAAKFRPDDFNAKTWVSTIKAAGMRYVIITAKHHDGFAIWPSNVNGYNIRDVAHFGRDPLRELVDEARRQGLHVGFYYSHAFDWEDPNAPGNDWDYNNPGGDRKLFGGAEWYNQHPELLPRVEKYVQGKAIPELRELISRYHPDILWFDTPSKLPFFQQIEIVKAVRLADPDVVINGRAARGANLNFGDYLDTADRPAELRPTAGDWEAIPTTNESYGYNKLDNTFKPVSYFIQLIAKAAAKGGDILLNIGPRGDGTLNPPDVSILQGIGKWMDVNAASIRGTERTPLDRQAWGDSTLHGNTLYLHIFAWPADGKLVVGGLQGEVKHAYLLAYPAKKPLRTSRANPTDLRIDLPPTAPDKADSVLVLEMAGPITGVPGRLLASNAGNNQLLAFDGITDGSGFSYGDGKTNRDYITGLEKPGNSLHWDIRSDTAADFDVSVRYSTPKAALPPGAHFTLTYGDQTLRVPVEATENDHTPRTFHAGVLHLPAGNVHPLRIMLESDRSPVYLFELSLQPRASTGSR